MTLRVRPGILEIEAYVPGEAELPGSGPIYKMSSNESPLGASPAAIEVYRALAGELHRYPDGGAVAGQQRRGARRSCGEAAGRTLPRG